MEIKKTKNGYSIEVDTKEYQTLVDSLYYAEGYWDSLGVEIDSKYSKMYDGFIKARGRYLSDDEAKPVVTCLTCKNCLPPMKRVNGKMCNQENCIYNPA